MGYRLFALCFLIFCSLLSDSSWGADGLVQQEEMQFKMPAHLNQFLGEIGVAAFSDEELNQKRDPQSLIDLIQCTILTLAANEDRITAQESALNDKILAAHVNKERAENNIKNNRSNIESCIKSLTSIIRSDKIDEAFFLNSLTCTVDYLKRRQLNAGSTVLTFPFLQDVHAPLQVGSAALACDLFTQQIQSLRFMYNNSRGLSLDAFSYMGDLDRWYIN